ncbi:hypothetical protein CASFOL_008693 [Castilleja foliolosa]|uniref:Uncharacterized protein n=1 Tax=Castilleja foliolosa TaxID=1961234 RepID=A0ABD3E3R8_9LAMI
MIKMQGTKSVVVEQIIQPAKGQSGGNVVAGDTNKDGSNVVFSQTKQYLPVQISKSANTKQRKCVRRDNEAVEIDEAFVNPPIIHTFIIRLY